MIAQSTTSPADAPKLASKATIIAYFLENISLHADKTAALVKRRGRYEPVTWGEMGDDSKAIARALVSEGIAVGERVAVMANTRYEWCSTDMGILWAGAVTVPIYASTQAEDAAYILDDSETVLAFVEDDAQATKLRNHRGSLGQVRRVVQLDGPVNDSLDGWVITLKDFLARGKDQSSDELEARVQALSRDSILTIIYTSGTTGQPKGVVLTHDAMVYEGEAGEQVGIFLPDDVQLLFLPLAHVFAKVLQVGWLTTRHVMAFAESFQTIKENMGETRPTVMAAVPRVYEKFYAAVVEKATSGGGLKAKLFHRALALSARNGELEHSARGRLGGIDALTFKVLQALIFTKIGEGLLKLMGGRMRVMISGGAPLSPQIGYFFRDAGLDILEGYGLTETSAASFCNRPGKNRIGTVGPPVPGTQVKIADDGEILIKGRGVMREYWKRPEATAEVLQDGWFYTGDIGELDAHGCLKITDRKKDIIVTAGGKNVAPQNIESMMKIHPLIANFVVHGDKRKFLSALVTLNADALHEFASKRGIHGSVAELSKHPEVQREIDSHIGATNAALANFETIKKYMILESDFSVETGELTPKLSVKRKVVAERYASILDQFYAE